MSRLAGNLQDQRRVAVRHHAELPDDRLGVVVLDEPPEAGRDASGRVRRRWSRRPPACPREAAAQQSSAASKRARSRTVETTPVDAVRLSVGSSDRLLRPFLSTLYGSAIRSRTSSYRSWTEAANRFCAMTASSCTSRPGTESFIAKRSSRRTAMVFRYGCGTQVSMTRESCAEPVRVVAGRGVARRCRGRMVQNLPHGCRCLRQRHAVRWMRDRRGRYPPLLGALEHERWPPAPRQVADRIRRVGRRPDPGLDVLEAQPALPDDLAVLDDGRRNAGNPGLLAQQLQVGLEGRRGQRATVPAAATPAKRGKPPAPPRRPARGPHHGIQELTV